MPRPHLAQAREIVIEHCRTLGVPYTETTLLKSYGIVIRYLNDVGLSAADPVECGLVQMFPTTGIGSLALTQRIRPPPIARAG